MGKKKLYQNVRSCTDALGGVVCSRVRSLFGFCTVGTVGARQSCTVVWWTMVENLNCCWEQRRVHITLLNSTRTFQFEYIAKESIWFRHKHTSWRKTTTLIAQGEKEKRHCNMLHLHCQGVNDTKRVQGGGNHFLNTSKQKSKAVAGWWQPFFEPFQKVQGCGRVVAIFYPSKNVHGGYAMQVKFALCCRSKLRSVYAMQGNFWSLSALYR